MTSTSTDRRDGINSSAAIKVACQFTTTANITLSGLGTQAGGDWPATLTAGDRIFAKDQTTGADRGIYEASTGSWERAKDFDTNRDVTEGTLISITRGVTLNDTVWRVTNTGSIVIGTTALTFEQAVFSSAVTAGFVQAGTGAVSRTAQEKMREWVTPEDFAAVGDGVTDDSTAMNNLAAAINAGTAKAIRLNANKTYLCGPVTTITVADVCIYGNGSTIKAKADSWSAVGDGSTHLNITGARPRIEHLILDGNQSAFTSAPGVGRMLQVDDAPTLVGVTVKNSPNVGMREDGAIGGSFHGCHFDDNAGLGGEFLAVSYQHFAQSTFNRNGYGFHGTRANPAATTGASTTFIAFATALRYRCHHMTFVGCEANENGRDGFNVNQGSYAIKFHACLCWANDDGGFTIASDNTATGRLGESEACYDLEYIGCESYNNWAGGLTAYQAAHNVTVKGGRYYNNHRLAGDQAQATSYYNGIYFAGGSTSINVETKAYDDRQKRVITAVAGSGTTRTLTATSWVSGTINYYPKVAVFTAAGVFRGYGRITAEASGSVTIQTTTNNGVNLGAIIATDYVTQCVQLNGLFFDNGCTARAAIDGWGHFATVSTDLQGRNIMSAGLGHGQNIYLTNARESETELLLNHSFDSNLAYWTFNTPGAGSASVESGSNLLRRSPGALKLQAGVGNSAQGDSVLATDFLKYVDDGWVEFSADVKCSAIGGANIILYWVISATTFNSQPIFHPGDGNWRRLRVTAFMPTGITDVIARVACDAAGSLGYFDNLKVRAIDDGGLNQRDGLPTSRYLPV